MIDQYLQEHSLNESFVKSLGWTFDESNSTIIIPIYNASGKLLYSRYRHLQGNNKFSTDKGATPALYCLHKATDISSLVLCEGEPDCARLWQEGIPAITGTAGVKTFSKILAQPLHNKEIIICLDNDEAGQESIPQYYKVLREVKAKPRIKQLPSEYKDISEYFTQGHTKDDFDKLPTLTLNEWLDKNIPEEYKLDTASDILKQKIPPEEWLVDRVIPAEGFTFIVGAEATGKSFYTLTLAKAISQGEPWLKNTATNEGKPIFPVKNKAKTLIIDKENTKRRIQSRMRWLDMGGDDIFFLRYPHYFELADPSEEDGLSKIAKEASRQVKKNKIKFIIVDSFTDIMVGNENAAGDVQGFFDAMRRLFPNTSILVLHHASKPTPGVTRTSAQRTRGSTNINAQVYSMFYVEAMPKSRTEFVWEQTKAGDAQKLSKFIVELDVQPIEGTEKTKVVDILYRGIVPDEEMKVQEAVKEIENILKTVSDIPRQELIEAVQIKGISLSTVKRALKEMLNDDLIQDKIDPNDKRKKVLSLVKIEENGVFYE